jgi:hypothetical protein
MRALSVPARSDLAGVARPLIEPIPDMRSRTPGLALRAQLTAAQAEQFRRLQASTGIASRDDLVRFALAELARMRGVAREPFTIAMAPARGAGAR